MPKPLMVRSQSLGSGKITKNKTVKYVPSPANRKRLVSQSSSTFSGESTDSEFPSPSHSITKIAELLSNATDDDLLGHEPLLLNREAEIDGVQEIIRSLTEREKSQLPDINMPIRHLRAEKGNVQKAIQKCKAALKWREEFGVGQITTCMQTGGELEKIIKFEGETGKIYVRGYDKDGRAVVYMDNSRANSDNVIDNMRHLVWNLEKAFACTARKSIEKGATRPLEKYCLAINFIGFQLSAAPSLSVSKFTLEILQTHYPERMHRAYVLNPPLSFRVFWNLVKPFIDPVTKSKIVFCSPGSEGMKQFHREMGPENLDKLEPFAGGTKKVKDYDAQEYFGLPMDVTFAED